VEYGKPDRLRCTFDTCAQVRKQQADDRFFWNKYLQTKLIDVTQENPDHNVRMPDVRLCLGRGRAFFFCS
jgi:hypothetical protein